jgi:putative transposase
MKALSKTKRFMSHLPSMPMERKRSSASGLSRPRARNFGSRSNDLKARGVNDILIAVVDGLKGFPEAITTVFPQTIVQTCIVHLIRNSLAFVSWKDRKAIMPWLKAIYRAEAADIALTRLEEFEAEWGKRYPAIGPIWRRAWEHVVPFFAFASGIRKMIYTTNCIEALNHCARSSKHEAVLQTMKRP